MIEYIKGDLVELTPTHAVLDVQGVGYLMHISLVSYGALTDKKSCLLWVYEAIREDAHVLYGFVEKAERALFLLLISVSGVGANTARMILSSLTAEELQIAISSGNVGVLKNVKGIGLKTAQRSTVDLKDKVDKVESSGELADVNVGSETKQEAVSALVMLGFQQSASLKVVEKLLKEDSSMALEKVIKRALQMF